MRQKSQYTIKDTRLLLSKAVTTPHRFAAPIVACVALASACGSVDDSAPVDAGAPEIQAADPPYLWYAGAGLNAFTKAQTEESSAQGGQFLLIPRFAIVNFHDLVFDDLGNLWTIPISGDQILRLPAAGLPPEPMAPGPDLVISSAALHSPQNLAFDGEGNLWVVSYDGAGPSIATIARFDDPRGLSGNVTLDPSATIWPGAGSDAQRQFRQPSAVAFDGAGSLWFSATSNVMRLDHPESFAGSVTATPDAIIASGDAYASLAFDGDGALWVTGANDGYFVARIANPGALAGAVNPPMAAKVILPSADALFAGGIAFDPDGALWVAMNNQILKLVDPGALSGEVTPTPDLVLGVTASPDLSSKLVFH
jgi:sugar lactone lactonase YvrE